MSGQALDLRRSAQIVWRYRALVGVLASLGLLAGVAYTVFNPPTYTSSALVVVSPSVNVATQVVVVTSDPVLSGALRSVDPHMSVGTLNSRVHATRMTSQVMSVSAQGTSAAQAEETANAVTSSYIAYVSSASSPIGQVPTRLLQPATGAVKAPLTGRLLGTAGLGVLLGALIGAVIALAISRSDRRLRQRDEIADCIGVPVLLSVAVGHPSDAAGWTKLLEDYEPGAVDAWRLRKALHQLGLIGINATDVRADNGSSLAVLSLSSDRQALALGPQLAAFAAHLGIPTTLVVGPQQDANTGATLRAACAGESALSRRSSHLRTAVSGQYDAGELPGAALNIVVAVVDVDTPRVTETMSAAVTVLAVSAGAATAEQLARVAASAADNGRDIAGILVANPDPSDQTTGRLPQLARPARYRMPTRMTGNVTETRK